MTCCSTSVGAGVNGIVDIPWEKSHNPSLGVTQVGSDRGMEVRSLYNAMQCISVQC